VDGIKILMTTYALSQNASIKNAKKTVNAREGRTVVDLLKNVDHSNAKINSAMTIQAVALIISAYQILIP
jgi:hypothetical protein